MIYIKINSLVPLGVDRQLQVGVVGHLLRSLGHTMRLSRVVFNHDVLHGLVELALVASLLVVPLNATPNNLDLRQVLHRGVNIFE